MTELVKAILGPFSGGVAFAVAVLLLIYFTQDRAAGIGRLAYAAVNATKAPMRSVGRLRRRRKLQQKINSIMSESGTNLMPLAVRRCKVAWEDPGISKEAFFEEKRFVMHVRRDFETDEELIRTVLLFISRSLLTEVKRFLSTPQRDAINLYYAARILERKSKLLSRQFATEFLPLDKLTPATAEYLETYHTLEQHAFFEDVLVREFEHVGAKIVAHPKADGLDGDFDALIDLLMRMAERSPGQEMDLTLERRFVRCAAVLVARRENLSDEMDAHVRYVQDILTPRQIERIYLLSDQSKKTSVDKIARAVAADWTISRRRSRRATLLRSMEDVYVLELTSKTAGVVPSGAIDRRRHSSNEDPAEVIALARPDAKVLGSIKWMHDDGWGFIRLDDPSFSANAWFPVSNVVNRPPVLGAGDRVSCEVIRDAGNRLRATRIEVIRGSRIRRVESAAAPSGAPANESDALTRIEGMSDSPKRDVALSVYRILRAQLDHGVDSVPLANVGQKLRLEDSDFKHESFGHPNLLSFITELGAESGAFFVDRFENGHPYVSLGGPLGESEIGDTSAAQ